MKDCPQHHYTQTLAKSGVYYIFKCIKCGDEQPYLPNTTPWIAPVAFPDDWKKAFEAHMGCKIYDGTMTEFLKEDNEMTKNKKPELVSEMTKIEILRVRIQKQLKELKGMKCEERFLEAMTTTFETILETEE